MKRLSDLRDKNKDYLSRVRSLEEWYRPKGAVHFVHVSGNLLQALEIAVEGEDEEKARFQHDIYGNALELYLDLVESTEHFRQSEMFTSEGLYPEERSALDYAAYAVQKLLK